jgi:hypothetical protein
MACGRCGYAVLWAARHSQIVRNVITYSPSTMSGLTDVKRDIFYRKGQHGDQQHCKLELRRIRIGLLIICTVRAKPWLPAVLEANDDHLSACKSDVATS